MKNKPSGAQLPVSRKIIATAKHAKRFYRKTATISLRAGLKILFSECARERAHSGAMVP
jgi:hypothetical protein